MGGSQEAGDRTAGGVPTRGPAPGVLLVLTALALVWRLVLAVWIVPAWESGRNTVPFPDHYPELARSILDGDAFGYAPGHGARPTTARGPGFPMWLALGMLLGGDGERWLRLWSSVPVLIVAPILAALAWRRFGAIPGAAAFAFLVFHPLPGVLSSRGMSDEFYASLGFGALLLWDRSLQSSGRRSLVLAGGAGVLLAVQMLTRVSGILTLAVLAGLGLWRRPRRAGTLAIMAAVGLSLPLAWSVRTSRLEGRPVFIHSLAAYNFWIGEAFERYGYSWTSSESWERVTDLIERKAGMEPGGIRWLYYPSLEPREVAAMERRLARAAREHVLRHPAGYGLRVLKGLGYFWIRARTPERTLHYGLLLLPVLLLVMPAFAPASFHRLVADRMLLACALIVAAHMLAYAAVLAMARFSVQVYPAVAWLLAAGTALLLGGRRPAPGGSGWGPHPPG